MRRDHRRIECSYFPCDRSHGLRNGLSLDLHSKHRPEGAPIVLHVDPYSMLLHKVRAQKHPGSKFVKDIGSHVEMAVDSGILHLAGYIEVKFDLLVDPSARSNSLYCFRLDVDPTNVCSPVFNPLSVHQDRRTSGVKANVCRVTAWFGLDRDLEIGSPFAGFAFRTGQTIGLNYLSFAKLECVGALILTT